ncbi:SRA stem-loop-interacting RNA-binding protein, mitochondrial-like [Ptychodera flava]|uniref:SRA stem-loop-interacting RNA-binding protein, mitochondrial-like n=1 Tax=Ptychodera flava TaxID=63121 RepID=UPI00396A73BE
MAGRQALSVYVSRIPWTISQRELKEYFSQFGTVRRAIVPVDKETGFFKRFAFIDFSNKEGFQNTIQRSAHVIEGTRIQVKPSQASGVLMGTASNRVQQLGKVTVDDILDVNTDTSPS